MMEWLVALGIKLNVLIFGFLGSVVSLKWFLRDMAVWERWITAVGGLAAALSLTQPVIDYFILKDSYSGGLGFVIGMFAMPIAAAFVETIKKADLLALFRRGP